MLPKISQPTPGAESDELVREYLLHAYEDTREVWATLRRDVVYRHDFVTEHDIICEAHTFCRLIGAKDYTQAAQGQVYSSLGGSLRLIAIIGSCFHEVALPGHPLGKYGHRYYPARYGYNSVVECLEAFEFKWKLRTFANIIRDD